MFQGCRDYSLKIRALFLIISFVLLVGIIQSSQGPTGLSAKETSPYIVTAVDMETAVAAVQQVGGSVTHELAIIDAVGVTLTSAQKSQLEQVKGITQIWADQAVSLAGEGDTLRDNFEEKSYSNNDGNLTWASDWIELGDDNKANDGHIEVKSSGYLELAETSASIKRHANLMSAQSAVLSYEYRRKDLEDEYVNLEISTDGGINWTELARYTAGDEDDEDFLSNSFDIAPYATADTVIRFAPSSDMDGEFEVDNLQIATVNAPDTFYPTLSSVDQLHGQGIVGSGTTVAVLDTGHYSHPALNHGTSHNWRVLAQYDAIMNQMDNGYDNQSADTDGNGHGTHVTSIIINSQRGPSGKYVGMAPDANLVSVKAFDQDGMGSYMDVIRGIEWVVANKDTYNIRVLNLSFEDSNHSKLHHVFRGLYYV